jgi:hypothetical protein
MAVTTRTTVTIGVDEVTPDRTTVLQHQGLPPGTTVPSHIVELHDAAVELFRRTAHPTGMFAEIDVDAFAGVYDGEGQNEPTGPVADIFPRADHLALFAVSLGSGISEAIADRFAANDFALASMLDAVASEAADLAAERLEAEFERRLRTDGWTPPDGGVLRYSPGYCGWHVTGQRRLFAALEPATIGIALTDSCLMQPLKSVSGVLIAGTEASHAFPPTYTFCRACETFACRDRLREMRTRGPTEERGSA